jgi:hypothetical protein
MYYTTKAAVSKRRTKVDMIRLLRIRSVLVNCAGDASESSSSVFRRSSSSAEKASDVVPFGYVRVQEGKQQRVTAYIAE